jgi:hypothetical protein
MADLAAAQVRMAPVLQQLQLVPPGLAEQALALSLSAAPKNMPP